ncbi:MFS transporter [Desulfobaculum sp. SPO524]|uniref:MFS transporter n=1 Tax=Desulfobaculum sp. SPO524 TaxID=3378071 RepID=UPI003853B533
MTISKRHTAILAGFIGNVVEWYDFALYGYMAGILSGLFFPDKSTSASLIATYGVFAAGFIMRPLGSAVFGWLGDTIGRSKTMSLSVTMMVLPTFILGCLPTFQSIGLWAPILLVLVRIVQGLSVGGEFSSSVTYLVETAPQSRRGLAGSWANSGSMLGMLLGSGAAGAVTSFLPDSAVQQWGWRLPFLAGGVLGLVAIALRRKLPSSEHFQRHHNDRPDTSPLIQSFTVNRKQTIKAILFASAYGVLFYIPLVYLPEWLHRETGMALSTALHINTAATATLLVLIPISGWLGDAILRRTHLLAGAMLITAVLAWPLYRWLVVGGVTAAIVVQVVLIVLIAAPLGSAPAMFAELFPAEDRLSGYSVAYNLGLGVVGGTTPMVATWLIDVTGISSAPAGLLTGIAVLAFGTLLTIRDRSREPLR